MVLVYVFFKYLTTHLYNSFLFLGWIQMLWYLIYFRITFHCSWGTFLYGWCFSVFWHGPECWRAYSSCPVIYGRGFLSPYGISLLLLMWGNWTWDMGSASSTRWNVCLFHLLKMRQKLVASFYPFWTGNGKVLCMHCKHSPPSYSPHLTDPFSRKNENLKSIVSSVFLTPPMEPPLAPIPIHGLLFFGCYHSVCLNMKKICKTTCWVAFLLLVCVTFQNRPLAMG